MKKNKVKCKICNKYNYIEESDFVTYNEGFAIECKCGNLITENEINKKIVNIVYFNK